MKNNNKRKKRIISLLMMVMLIVTMIPSSAAEALQSGNEKLADSESPSVSVKFEEPDDEDTEKEEVKKDSKTVLLKAFLDEKKSEVLSAYVKIALSREEVKLLKSIGDENFSENSESEDEKSEKAKTSATDEEKLSIALETEESGEIFIKFALNKENLEINTEIKFEIPGDMDSDKNKFEIDIAEDDIIVETKSNQQEQEENPIIEREGIKFSLEREKTSDKKSEEKSKTKDTASIALQNDEDLDIEINEYNDPIEKTIYWADNNDKADVRPEASSSADSYQSKYKPVIKYSFDGGMNYSTLTEDNMKYLGLKSMPEGTVYHEPGMRQYHYSMAGNKLPSKITYTDEYDDETVYDIKWKIEPAEVDNYALADVNESNIDNYPSAEGSGWYYMLKDSFNFNIVIKWGSIGQDKNLIDKVVKDLESISYQFSFDINFSGKSDSYTLKQLEDMGVLERSQGQLGNNNLFYIVTLNIHDIWKYNLDGSKMSYDVIEKPEKGSPTGKVEISDDVLGEGYEDDYFAISYDNMDAPNVGNVDDKVHSGGTLYLTLTGEAEFEATKAWLDEDSDKERPEGELQLWRYRAGEMYKTAASVRDSEGKILTCKLDTSKDEQKIEFKDSKGNDVFLEKFDSEGCEYYYVARECLNGSGYEQIFGEVSQDEKITDITDKDGKLVVDNNATGTREDSNDFLYNGGTLSNRIDSNIEVKATKIWRAAAFQSEFEDVAVELTLQSRVKGDSQSKWTNVTDKPVRIEGFELEHLSESCKESVPEYNMLGQELEYRWIETGVFQGIGSTVNLIKASNSDADTEKKFTLEQSGKTIDYVSNLKINEDGDLIIENSIENTVHYDIVKKWKNDKGEDISAPEGTEVKFALYRSEGNADSGEKVGVVTLDGKKDTKKQVVNEELGIYAEETSAWTLRISPLDEYNEDGRLYGYYILESNGKYMPEYEITKDDEGNYKAVVTNVPGEGNRIIVQKNWVDDSNIADRRSVTVGVYDKNTNERITEITLKEGLWSDYAYIGKRSVDEVYILEETLGKGTDNIKVEDLSNPKAPDLYKGDNNKTYTKTEYDTGKENYKYIATYSKEKLEGETVYSVTNFRVGDIDLTVIKTWLDGDSEARDKLSKEIGKFSKDREKMLTLSLKLDFGENSQSDEYKISYTGIDTPDYVDIGNLDGEVKIKTEGGQDASAVQAIDISKDESSYYFYGLPKYDGDGKVVNYRAEEVWVNSKGDIVDLKELSEKDKDYEALYEAWKDYRVSYSSESYVVGDYHSDDKQGYTLTNKLSGTKDVGWYKDWNDEYVYEQGNRPDIFLNIYSVKHNSLDEDDTEISLVEKNYKWTYTDKDNIDIRHHWHIELSDLPKYDNYGYEIQYYAVENTSVNKAEFDYTDTQYYMSDNCDVEFKERIGSEFEIADQDALASGKVLDVSGVDVSRKVSDNSSGSTTRYALIEGGTFSNNIYYEINITGEKIWSSLPTGYDKVNLPTVTFTLYRNDPSQPDKDPEYVADITVSQWAEIQHNGSYTFELPYKGTNTMIVKDDGTVEITGEDIDGNGPVRLTRYNKDGQVYDYTLKETDIKWNITGPGTVTAPDSDDVFDKQPFNGYKADNAYKSIKGSLSIKKFLELPMDINGEPEAYPGVTFELLRTYTENDGTTSSPEVVTRKTWTSSEVKEDYKEATGIKSKIKAFFMGDKTKAATADDPLEKILTFGDLDIYAPNGSEYVYQVREVKDNLGGYDTWAKVGNLTAVDVKTDDNKVDDDHIIGNLSLERDESKETVKATFLNAPAKDREKVKLSGKKLWQDYSDAFSERPNDIEIKLYRYADSQPGQSNPVSQKEVSKDLYQITWVKDDAASAWSYTIEGAAGVDNELEKYADNGMIYKYRVEEISLDGSIYTSTPNVVNEQSRENTDVNNNGLTDITMGNLTNSIMTSVSYSKKWVDSNNNTISKDVLGVDVTVDFTLQVAEGEQNTGGSPTFNTDWSDAGDYFSKSLPQTEYEEIFGSGDSEYSFTAQMSGKIDDKDAWKEKTFSKLPRYIKKSGETDMTRLYYRVVETKISYGNTVQTVIVKADNTDPIKYTYEFTPGIFSPAYPVDKVTGTSQGYNSSSNSTAYNMLQTTDFSVTKKWENDRDNIYGTRPDTERTNYDWEVQYVIQRSSDGGATWENVPVYKEAAGVQQESALIVYLYGTDKDESKSAEVSGLLNTGVNGETYEYRARELKPAEDRYADGIVADEDIIEDGDSYNASYEAGYENDGRDGIVTNALKETKIYAEKIWNKSANTKEITFELQYLVSDGGKETWKSFTPNAKVTLDGKIDGTETDKDYTEYLPWKAVWYGVPEVMPDSVLDGNNKTQYQIKETITGSYKQESVVKTTAEVDGVKYTKFEITNNETTSLAVEKKWYGVRTENQKDVVVGLWRTTGTPEDENSEEVTDSQGSQLTKTLKYTASPNTSWKATFTGLSKYNNDKDSDDYGKAYTYYARELTIGGIPADECNYRIISDDGKADNGTFTSTVTNIGRRDISGTKTWKDNGNAYGTRPDSIELALYRTAQGGDEEEVSDKTLKEEGAFLEWSDKDTDTWTYTYKNLPRANDEGKGYTYRVEEKDVKVQDTDAANSGDKYAVSQSGNNLTNTLANTIDIPVTKKWLDRDDKYDYRPDKITVILYGNDKEVARGELSGSKNEWKYTFKGLDKYDKDGKKIDYRIEEEVPDGYDVSIDGFTIKNTKHGSLSVAKTLEGNAVDKDKEFNFTVTLSDTDINGVYGDMEFTDGIAHITLKHGEVKTADELPADIGYMVTETEANTDGYKTTSENATGTVPAGDNVKADFVNSKNTTTTTTDNGTKTGDSMNIAIPLMAMTLSLIGIAAMLLRHRKKS